MLTLVEDMCERCSYQHANSDRTTNMIDTDDPVGTRVHDADVPAGGRWIASTTGASQENLRRLTLCWRIYSYRALPMSLYAPRARNTTCTPPMFVGPSVQVALLVLERSSSAGTRFEGRGSMVRSPSPGGHGWVIAIR